MICDQDPDLGMATQLSGLLKMLIDPDNMLTSSSMTVSSLTAKSQSSLQGPSVFQQQKSEKSEFLNYFYKYCIHCLTVPILAATHQATTFPPQAPSVPSTPPGAAPAAPNAPSNDNFMNQNMLALLPEQSSQVAQLLSIVLELLTFCVEHHGYHIRSYMLQKLIIYRIMNLTRSKHKHLVLCKCFPLIDFTLETVK